MRRVLGVRQRVRRATPPHRGQRGAAAVEFALVVPILLVIVFGIINFGFVMTQKAALSNAVRAGARYGTVNAYAGDHSCGKVIDRVRAESTTLGIGSPNQVAVRVTLAASGSPAGTGDLVCAAAAGAAAAGGDAPCINADGSPSSPDELTVTSTFDTAVFVPTPGLGNSVTLTQSSTFVCEYYQ